MADNLLGYAVQWSYVDENGRKRFGLSRKRYATKAAAKRRANEEAKNEENYQVVINEVRLMNDIPGFPMANHKEIEKVKG